jgi:hypothetical protein
VTYANRFIRYLAAHFLALCMHQLSAEELEYFDQITVGMSREQIVEMIGEPDQSSAASEVEYMVYYLPGSGRMVDQKCLTDPGPGPSIGVIPPECVEDADILLIRIEAGVAVIAHKTLDDIDLESSLRAAVKLREEQKAR